LLFSASFFEFFCGFEEEGSENEKGEEGQASKKDRKNERVGRRE